jgi:FKBP-type peptidyl-prolyl cis-trans isomerase (trigger factor)
MLRSRIIQEYGLNVEQADMDAEIARLATMENMQPDELRKKLTKEQKRHIHDDLMERKLFEFLESKIKTVNSTVPLAEFEGRAESKKIITV